MSSFSDAHESWNIPIIARQLHHLVPPRQSQIWAVLYPDNSPERFVYSLAATFLGRMCLSGPVHDLSDGQMDVIRRATALYAQAAPVICEGRTRYLGETPPNWNHPTGWQGVCRINDAGDRALVVVHAFAEPPECPVEIELPGEGWSILGSLHDGTAAAPAIGGGRLVIPQGAGFRGWALLLGKCAPGAG